MSWQMQAILDADDSLQQLAESIHRVQTAWPVTGANSTVGGNGAPTEPLRQLISDLNDMARRCENLPGEAVSIVESAWENLEADQLADWDAVGRQVLDLLSKQAKAVAQAANLLDRAERGGLFPQGHGKLSAARSLLLERERDFWDSWPWSTGNKPGDEEDAAGARKALEALPSFDVLWRLAREYPPPEGWPDEE